MGVVEDDKEPPLDPAMERVQARLRRLILVSGSTLGLGFLAVVVAVIFRVSNLDRGPADGEPWRTSVDLPAGASVLSTDVDGDRLAVTVEDAAGRRVLVFDMPTGRALGETVLVPR
jgi:hypothetical protein